MNFRKLILTGAAMAGAFLLPLAPWAARNLITLHEFQIIAPRYATMPGEYATVGYFAWTGTWLERYRDVYLNVWKIGEEPVDLEDLPAEAFDSPQEKARIATLYEKYNNSEDLDISPEVDRQFAEVARERTRRHPLRTYVRVPFQRALTIWFTPRTEMLPIDGKFWPIREQWQDSNAAFLTTAGFAALGYIYVALAMGGICVAWRAGRTRHRRFECAGHAESLGCRVVTRVSAGAYRVSHHCGGPRASVRRHLLSRCIGLGCAALGDCGNRVSQPGRRHRLSQRSSTGSG